MRNRPRIDETELILEEHNPETPPTGGFQTVEWSQAGKSLAACTGFACVALALYRGDDLIGELLRTWVGLFGVLVVVISFRSGRA